MPNVNIPDLVQPGGGAPAASLPGGPSTSLAALGAPGSTAPPATVEMVVQIAPGAVQISVQGGPADPALIAATVDSVEEGMRRLTTELRSSVQPLRTVATP